VPAAQRQVNRRKIFLKTRIENPRKLCKYGFVRVLEDQMKAWWHRYRGYANAMHPTTGYQSERLYRVGFELTAELASMGIMV
jgi:hypothetical protein